jgi:DNA topoisomerase-1
MGGLTPRRHCRRDARSMPATSTRHANARHATASKLVYVSDAEPGIRRRGNAPAFHYIGVDGRQIRDRATLERIRALAIPPAYTDVWVSTQARGHLQATGRDARNRKQYRYHADWRHVRGEGKFARIVAFGAALPRLRRRLRNDLKAAGFPREKVLAIVVSVLAETLVRVGNREYARSNRSYGLTTLRNQHIDFLRGGRARFRFRGKSGQDNEIVLDDARLARLLRHCQQLPGQALFQYIDDAGKVQPVDSGQVNAYLGDAMGEAFTAKDFRTWGATLAAFRQLAKMPWSDDDTGEAPSVRALATGENAVIREVAGLLGNTPAVCRSSYIDPAVLAGWRDGRLQRAAEGAIGERQWEQAALRFLRSARRRK